VCSKITHSPSPTFTAHSKLVVPYQRTHENVAVGVGVGVGVGKKSKQLICNT